MTYNPLHPFKRQYRAEHIARGIATRWRPADAVEQPIFLARVNAFFGATSDEPLPNDVFFNARRREVALCVKGRDYRVILKPGVEPWGASFKPITAGDVERFESRLA